MRSQVVNFLNANQDYYFFMRQHPTWHRTLSRYPNQLNNFLESYKTIRRKRLVDRIEDFSMMANIINNMPPNFN